MREFLKSPLIEKKEIENRHKIVELFLYNLDSLFGFVIISVPFGTSLKAPLTRDYLCGNQLFF